MFFQWDISYLCHPVWIGFRGEGCDILKIANRTVEERIVSSSINACEQCQHHNTNLAEPFPRFRHAMDRFRTDTASGMI